MGRGVKKLTFAEMVKDAAHTPAMMVPLRPGRVNRAGVLASPDGAAFTREREAIDSATARELVGAGALVAMEPCGCGGDYCEPEWMALADLAGLATSEPVRTRGSAPSWIDVWYGPSGLVVFVHGDYRWDVRSKS